MRLGLIQINPLLGDLRGNTDKIIKYIEKSISLEVDIAVFPELCICGYPPEDLLLKPHFVVENKQYLKRIIPYCKGITAVIGFPDTKAGRVYNAAAIIKNGKIIYIYHKMHLPNYGVFDEKRYFAPGTRCGVIRDKGICWAVNICEDIWVEAGPTVTQARSGCARLIINISASPYHRGKLLERENILKKQAIRNKVTIAYCNLVGGQDELVFDGGSLIISPKGKVLARARQFEEDILVADLGGKELGKQVRKPLEPLEEVYTALLLGTRDYVTKNNFKKVILGISGGIDSALVGIIAVDALGKENVIGITMPSQFTSSGTLSDSETLAKNLGIKLITIPIKPIFEKYTETLEPHFHGKGWDATEENIQARIRGNILMAFSNKFGYLVLTTGNKSETSVGYCTLYGDMAGGFAVIKDVPKQLVYKLARERNKHIPDSIFTRPPTAELRENQKDSDSLPPYSELDPIIEKYVEQDKSLAEIIKEGVPEKTASRVVSLIDRNEYKRRQAPPGIKITPKAFGRDRRMPITCARNSA